MPVKVVAKELPGAAQKSLEEAISAALLDTDDDWVISISPDAADNAWEVQVHGPGNLHWSRRFSGDDRDEEVIAAAVQSSAKPPGPALNNALSALAIQGIAFMSEIGRNGETEYIVDRVRLKEGEIVYLHRQGALTTTGIRKYLLNRRAA